MIDFNANSLFINQFVNCVHLYGQNTAIWTNGKFYTYSELSFMAGGISDSIDFSTQKAEWIGILCDEEVWCYAAILACWANETGYVPISSHQPTERNAIILREAGVKRLFVSRKNEYSNNLYDLLPDIQFIETSALSQNLLKVNKHIELESPAYLLFTSGSTGVPKGVIISQSNVSAFLQHMLNHDNYDFTADDRFLMMFELTFDASMMSFLVALSIGASFYVVPRKGILNLNIFNLLENKNISVANVVPSFLQYLKPWFNEISLPNLRWFLSGGESFSYDLASEWKKNCAPNATIENVYGPTEATIFCHTFRLNPSGTDECFRNNLPIGKCMRGVNAFIINNNLQVLPLGETGEIALSGQQVSMEYFNDSEKTKKAFCEIFSGSEKHRVYRTGDLGFIDKNGNFNFCGRKDQQVKVDGYRVEMGEVEFYARKAFRDRNLALIATGDNENQLRILLFVEGSLQGCENSENALRNSLPHYMLPSEIIFIDKLPLNANGKTDYQALKLLIKY